MDRRTFCFGLLSMPAAASAALLRLSEGATFSLSGAVVWDHSEELRFVLNDPLDPITVVAN
jgi:hypothetical protein